MATGVLATFLAASALSAATGDDRIPPQWTAVQIDFKATWDETLAANPESAQTARIQADPALCGAAKQILALRKIHRLEAMMLHFPTATDKFPNAYRDIADTHGPHVFATGEK